MSTIITKRQFPNYHKYEMEGDEEITDPEE